MTVEDLVKRRKTSRSIGSDGERLELYLSPDSSHLMKLKEDLKLGRYKPRPLMVKLIPKKRWESPRAIFVPSNRDYIVARAVNIGLRATEEFSIDSSKTVIRDLINYVSKDSRKFSYIIRLDIRDFFGSLPYERAFKRLLNDSSVDREILYVLEQFSDAAQEASVRYGAARPASKELTPQGLPYSPVIANWYLESLRQRSRIWPKDLKVYRYFDDMLLLFEEDTFAPRVYWKNLRLKTALRLSGFRVHSFSENESKSQIIRRFDTDREFKFLGLSMELTEDGALGYGIPSKVLKAEKSKLWRLFNRHFGSSVPRRLSSFDPENRRSFLQYRVLLTSAGCRYQGKVQGFCNYWSITDDAAAFKLLDVYVEKLCKRFSVPGAPLRSEYFKSFQSIRSDGYRERYLFDYDNIGPRRKSDILVRYFGVRPAAIKGMGADEFDAFWHRTLRGELKGLFSSGYVSY